MKKVAIYRTSFPQISEPFIIEQARNLMTFAPRFYVRTKLEGAEGLDMGIEKVLPEDGAINKLMFTLTRNSRMLEEKLLRWEPALVHAHFGSDGVMVLPTARKLGLPLVTTFHGFDVTLDNAALLKSKKPTFISYIARRGELRHHGSRFVAVSKYVQDRLLRLDFPADRIRQIYIGVDVDKFSPARVKAGNERRIILNVARHITTKGIDDVIVAFSKVAWKHRDVDLVQIGAGPLTERMVSLAREVGLEERCFFLGAQSHAAIIEWMRKASIFTLTSRATESGQREALGIVLNEAAACALPIVATKSGGIPETVVDGVTGFLATEQDRDELAQYFDYLLEDVALCTQFGARGREYACDVFNISRQTRKLEAVYDELL
ncbi:D-inositol-3-phosphate glycosyltransferase [compost metagenome]